MVSSYEVSDKKLYAFLTSTCMLHVHLTTLIIYGDEFNFRNSLWNFLLLFPRSSVQIFSALFSQTPSIYEGCLKSSWTQLITPSRNYVEMRWRSLFGSTSLGKRCTSYNAPPPSRKRAAHHLPQASGRASKLPFHGWKSPGIEWGKIWTVWRMF
jgi:hypothetical protein